MDARWIVTLVYRSDSGPVDVEHHVEELDEIMSLVENGPDWNALDHGTFRLNPKRATTPGITIEESVS